MAEPEAEPDLLTELLLKERLNSVAERPAGDAEAEQQPQRLARRGRRKHGQEEPPAAEPASLEEPSKPRSARILVNVRPRETRVALVEEGRLAELHVEREQEIVGNIYKGRVEQVVPGLDAAFVDIGLPRNGFLHVDDAVEEEAVHPRRRNGAPGSVQIRQILQANQELIVQVTKGSVGTKGPRLTTHISLPGKYSVLTAQTRKGVGVSRKIEDDKERERLRQIGEQVCPKDLGLIMRTQAAAVGLRELRHDVAYLQQIWNRVDGAAKQATAPALLHQELSLSHEVLRDIFSHDVRSLLIDDRSTYEKVVEFLSALEPRLKSRVALYEGEDPLFQKYGIEAEIEKALKRTVRLDHGGFLVIDSTEAFTVIDVNSGKFTGSGSLEQTILKTNLEAASEIARQLRLRDIGGIVVIDFIDMDRPSHRQQVMKALRDALRRDRVKARVVHLTPLGLVEMTRQRHGKGLAEKLNVSCPTCNGDGVVLSPETVCINLETDIRRRVRGGAKGGFQVVAHPRVSLHFIGDRGEQVSALERELGVQICVRCANRVPVETYRLEEEVLSALRKEQSELRKGRKYEIRPDQLLRSPFDEGDVVAIVHGFAVFVENADPEKFEEGLEIKLTEKNRSWCVATVTREGLR